MPGWLIEKGWVRFGSQVRGVFGSFLGALLFGPFVGVCASFFVLDSLA